MQYRTVSVSAAAFKVLLSCVLDTRSYQYYQLSSLDCPVWRSCATIPDRTVCISRSYYDLVSTVVLRCATHVSLLTPTSRLHR